MEIKITEMQFDDLINLDISCFDDFWNINILENDFKQETSYYIIAKNENNILGFAGLNFILDEAHIANIAVKKDMRNLKIGSQLLEALIDKAKSNSSLITLEVNSKNSIAIHLYKKYNFEIVRH